MRLSSVSLKALFLVLMVIPGQYALAGDYERKVPYTGSKISSSSLLCKANDMAAAGFWRKQNGVIEEGGRLQAEPQPTFWKISLLRDAGIAQVIRFNSNSEELVSPVVFDLEMTPPGGILLISAKRARGTSPETISIDPGNSSFVYSSQHVNSAWNRANIWYGSCRSDGD